MKLIIEDHREWEGKMDLDQIKEEIMKLDARQLIKLNKIVGDCCIQKLLWLSEPGMDDSFPSYADH